MSDFLIYGLGLASVLLFASLSGMMSEKTGVVNIGIEGMMTIGALVVAILGTFINRSSNNATQFIAILIAMVVAGLFSMLHAFPSITLKANQVVSGTALNLLASGLALFIVSGSFFSTNSTAIATGYKSILIGNILPVWLVIAALVAVGLFVFLKFTKFGMRYTMVGENPNAVDAVGISVNKYRYLGVFISGCLAGLAGGAFVLTISNGTFTGSTMGWGFLAMGIMIFGQWKIHYITIGVIIFAILFALGNQIILVVHDGPIEKNATIFKIMPFALTLFVMLLFSKRSKAPAANGLPFDKAKR